MICDGLTTAARELLEVEDWIDRCGDHRGYCRVKCEDGCGFWGCVTAGFSLPKGCYATILLHEYVKE